MPQIDELRIDSKSLSYLAKNYNPLDYRSSLASLLLNIYPNTDFTAWNKLKLHELLNETILHYYSGEQIFKYQLFKSFQDKNVVAAFEIKVNNSRADFITINGHTNSFEIKSNLDNLNKLKKQSSDYILAFEYNYLVIDERHLLNALDLVPPCFGLWSFKGGKKKIYRKAALNLNIDPFIQLSLLTKRELTGFFREVEGDKTEILKNFSDDEINKRFKKSLKSRYLSRWDFIVANQERILPIDIQFFFKTNISPDYIYY